MRSSSCTAWPICPIPMLCSRAPVATSSSNLLTRCDEQTISSIVAPAALTIPVPASTCSTLLPIRDLISRAASALRFASMRTSLATTAKPRPCSPARAASMAALRARIFVWKAMLSMVPMISAICAEDVRMPSIVSTTLRITRPPFAATWALCPATRAASSVCSVVLFTVEEISSIDAAHSWRLAAACSVRPERSVAPLAISLLDRTISSLELRTRSTMARSDSCIRRSSSISCEASSLPQSDGEVVRSPSVMARLRHGALGHLLCLFPGHRGGRLLCLGPDDDTVGDFHMLAGGVHARLHRLISLCLEQPADQNQHWQHEGKRNDHRLGGEPQLSKDPHTRCPDAVVGKESGMVRMPLGVGDRTGASWLQNR